MLKVGERSVVFRLCIVRGQIGKRSKKLKVTFANKKCDAYRAQAELTYIAYGISYSYTDSIDQIKLASYYTPYAHNYYNGDNGSKYM